MWKAHPCNDLAILDRVLVHLDEMWDKSRRPAGYMAMLLKEESKGQAISCRDVV